MPIEFPPGRQRRDSLGCLILVVGVLFGLLVAIMASVGR